MNYLVIIAALGLVAHTPLQPPATTGPEPATLAREKTAVRENGTSTKTESAKRLIDRYIDARFESKPDDTKTLLKQMKLEGQGTVERAQALEQALRAPRHSYPDLGALTGKISAHSVRCYHVDYQSKFLLYVPKLDEPPKRWSLVLVGHGGNSSMSPRRAESTASLYLRVYAGGLKNHLVVAPVSSRGWGHIGNSLILSTISKMKRMFPIDPDRIYVTGQSMGGHMTYRAALTLPDRWGAVSPHSGGYDFVAKKSIENLRNVPGYAIWGRREPYGINKDNRTNAEWGKTQQLDWKWVEKNGGHTIYQDELGNVSRFFQQHPRNLYRKNVFFRMGGTMKFLTTWNVKSWPKHQVFSDKRPLRWNLRHWIEVQPRPDFKQPQTVKAENLGDNQIELKTENVQRITIHLHPKMVDFTKPVKVSLNGKTRFNEKVIPNLIHMLETVREFDDRGRIYWAKLTLELESPSKTSDP